LYSQEGERLQRLVEALKSRILSSIEFKVGDSCPFERAFERSLLKRAGRFRQPSGFSERRKRRAPMVAGLYGRARRRRGRRREEPT